MTNRPGKGPPDRLRLYFYSHTTIISRHPRIYRIITPSYHAPSLVLSIFLNRSASPMCLLTVQSTCVVVPQLSRHLF